MHQPSRSFAIALRRRRVGVGLTQRALAETAGVSLSSVRNWECGRRVPLGIMRRAVERALENATAAGEGGRAAGRGGRDVRPTPLRTA
jgi:transcriptional regulator with XRE-family HTH domain